MTAEKTVQGRANLVAATSLDSVALSATGLEQTGTLLCVTWNKSVSSGSGSKASLFPVVKSKASVRRDDEQPRDPRHWTSHILRLSFTGAK